MQYSVMATNLVDFDLEAELLRFTDSESESFSVNSVDAPSADFILERDEAPRVTLRQHKVRLDLGLKPDLRFIALHVKNSEYNPRRFNCCMLRMRVPRCSTIIYPSGIMMVACTSSTGDAFLGAKKFVRILQKCGQASRKVNRPTLLLTPVFCYLGFEVMIGKLSRDFPDRTKYDAETSSGVLYWPPENDATVLINASGSMRIGGSKTLEDAQKIVDSIFPLLKKYKKDVLRFIANNATNL